MKAEIVVYKTAEQRPTKKDAMGEYVVAFDRSFRIWVSESWDFIYTWPERYPLWFSPRELPKLESLRKRGKKS